MSRKPKTSTINNNPVNNPVNIEPYTNNLTHDSQQFIANLAISDAKHDKLVSKTDDEMNLLNYGLPIHANDFIDETDVFKSLFNHIGQDSTLKDSPIQYLKTLNSKTGLDADNRISCTIGIPNGKTYNYNVFNFPVERTIPLLGKRVFTKGNGKSPLTTDKTFASFIKEQTRAETEAINFIVDFNQSGFLDLVRKDSKHAPNSEAEPRINYLMTPEVANDPAGKTNLSDNLFKKDKTNFVPWLDTTVMGSNYNNFDSDPTKQSSLSGNFYSNYSILLNKLKSQNNYKSTKIIGDGQISLPSDENSVYPFTSEDGSNANAPTLSRIKNILNRLLIRIH